MIVSRAKWEAVSSLDKPLFWIRKTALNKLHQLERDRRGTVPLDNVAPEKFTEPSNSREAQMVLEGFLRRLPPRQAMVVALEADGHDEAEICQQLSLAQTTVRTYKAEARRRLKEFAEECGWDAATRRRP